MRAIIQWPRAQYWDKPWNPMIGCQPCSPACENCYAKTISARFKVNDFTPRETAKERPPTTKVVFCGNMTDLFGDWLTWHDGVDFIKRTLGHSDTATYLWCTKRPSHMFYCLSNGRVFLKGDDDCDYAFRDCEMRNQFFGFTVENQEWYNHRASIAFRHAPEWANVWLSCEPLLGPIDFKLDRGVLAKAYRWVAVGCESGPNRRPCKMEWIEGIVYQCRAAGVPVFVKQLDINGKCERDITKFPAHLRIRQVPWPTKKEGAE